MQQAIHLYDPVEQISATVLVVKQAENVYKMLDNHILDKDLTFGTEFEVCINADNQYEFVRITKPSEFITTRFTLTKQFNASEYQILGDEIIKAGGFWQIDFDSLAVVNLPKNSRLDLSKVFKIFGFL